MNRKLREREVDTFFVESIINSLIRIKINTPVIPGLYPYANNHVHTACIQCMKGNKGSGVFNTRLSAAKTSRITRSTLS